MKSSETRSHMDCGWFSWKPIIAGALIAIGFSFLLTLFSVAIGLTGFTTGSDGVEKVAISGLIATALGIIVSMFGAGWLTGYLGKHYCPTRHLGAVYGFLAWCLALIITVFFASHAQQYVSFYAHVISGSADVMQISHNATAAAPVHVTATNVPAAKLVISTYILFTLFFLSAVACSLGGHAGMRHKCKDESSY